MFLMWFIIISQKPKNKVKFFVAKQYGVYGLRLFLGKPVWDKNTSLWTLGKNGVKLLATNFTFEYYNLNPNDFTHMRCGEIREVFINMEDWLWKRYFIKLL